jgi:GDPmannose 4,6-dehydratase
MSGKKALICGISGQDGAFLAELLLKKGYQVHGASRDFEVASFKNLEILRIRNEVALHSMSLLDFRSVVQTISEVRPDEIYNLSGQSSVALSFEQPMETLESISVGTLNLLDGIKFIDRDIKLYNASSGECFGDTGYEGASEDTPFRPQSPYAVAKATAFWHTTIYRKAYGLNACSGILFNHESYLRPSRFVSKKIIRKAHQIANNQKVNLCLGNIEIMRDWGWAPEYVHAMYLMLQQTTMDDYVIATGKCSPLRRFIELAFSYFNLNWEKHVTIDETLKRPSDHFVGVGNPKKAELNLGWRAELALEEIVKMMCDYEVKQTSLSTSS